MSETTWWTWPGSVTGKAHLRWTPDSFTVCGRAPLWYAPKESRWAPAPDDLPRCRTCQTIAGRRSDARLVMHT